MRTPARSIWRAVSDRLDPERRLVVLLEVGLDDVSGDVELELIHDHFGARRPLLRREPRGGVPHATAAQGLRTVDVALVDVDDHGDLRTHTIDRRGRQDLRIRRDGRPTVDAQRLADARHEEQHPDVRVLDDVAVRVETVVPGQVGERDVVGIENLDESWWSAARRRVGSRRRGGGEHDER